MQGTNTVQYAGFWMRFLAYIVDAIVLGIANMIVNIPMMMFSPLSKIQGSMKTSAGAGTAPDPSLIGQFLGWYAVLVVVDMAVFLIYYAAFESSNSQATPGKMALGLIVTDQNGERVSFAKSLGRNLGKLISGLILSIGYIMAGFTERKQALHDIMAGCLVIKKPR